MAETKFKVGQKVKTRAGQDARIICVDAKACQPIVALHVMDSGDEIVMMHNADGSYLRAADVKHSDDLMVPPLFRVGEVVKTRDGRTARILATDLKGRFPIAAAVEVEVGAEMTWSFTSEGQAIAATTSNYNDLIPNCAAGAG